MIIVRALLISIAFVIYKMPFFIHQSFAWIIAFVWFDLLRIRRKTAIDNILIVFPHFSLQQAKTMGRKSIYHMGLTIMEFFSMPFLWENEFRQMFEIEGEEYLKAALKENNGVFLLSAHRGNGDLGTAALASWGYKVHIISKIFKNSWLNKLWFSSREAKGVKFIPPRKSSYEILKALKAQEIVIFVLDQYTGPPNGVLTYFFNKKTGTAAGLALFSQRAQAPVLPVFTQRIGPNKHKITVRPPVKFEEQSTKDETIIFMTEKFNREVEAAILEAPEQWMWVHRRWKVGFVGQ